MARMKAPINTVKHYVQRSNITVASGARTSFLIAHAKIAPATTLTSDVREGALIKSCYIEIWVKGNGASDADTQFNIVLERVDGQAAVGITYAQMLLLQAYQNKKNVLFAGQGVIGGVGGGNAVPVMRGWYKIPKGKQRFGLDDFLQVSVAFTGEGGQACGLAVYKEIV